MARMTAAERYTARKIRVAIDARARLLAAADTGARHARLRAKYGPDWEGKLRRSINQRQAEWTRIADRNPYVRPSDPEFGWYGEDNLELLIAQYQQAAIRAVNGNLWRGLRRPRNPHPGGVA